MDSKVPDMFGDCKEFGELYNKRTGNHFSGKINKKFIRQMVLDELDELDEAKDEAEEVDALLDATYYILHHLSGTGLDIRPIWNLIHKANMTKFGPGGYKNKIGNGVNQKTLLHQMMIFVKKFQNRETKINFVNLILKFFLLHLKVFL